MWETGSGRESRESEDAEEWGGNLSWRISLILTWLPSLPAASLSGCAGTYSL